MYRRIEGVPGSQTMGLRLGDVLSQGRRQQSLPIVLVDWQFTELPTLSQR